MPTNLLDNVRYRQRLLARCLDDKDMRRTVRSMCYRDILFWWATFLYTFNPRLVWNGPRYIPFVPYPFQVQIILEIKEALESGFSRAYRKSRDVGISYVTLGVFDWFATYRKDCTFLIISRKEDLVDKVQDPDSLMWKIDKIHERLPNWIRPSIKKGIDRQKLHIYYPESGSTIDGASTTKDVSRGGRRTGVMQDEAASFERQAGYDVQNAMQQVTRTRIYLSSVKPPPNAFDDVCKRVRCREIHWTVHPLQRRGLYRVLQNGQLRIDDQQFWDTMTVRDVRKLAPEIKELFQEDISPGDLAYRHYPFNLSEPNQVRSPYYDNECAQAPNKNLVDQELDMKAVGAGGRFFDSHRIKLLEDSQQAAVRPQRGSLSYRSHDLWNCDVKFAAQPNGALLLWAPLTAQGLPIADRKYGYIIGADISAGTSASNSCACVIDMDLGEQVAELVTCSRTPDEFAIDVLVLGRFFGGKKGVAYLIADGGGPGGTFLKQIRDLGYKRLHYHRKTDGKVSSTLGFHVGQDGLENVLTEFGRAVFNDELILRSKDAMGEMRCFGYDNRGKVVHDGASMTVDPSGAGKNHGDRVVAAAIAWYGYQIIRPSRRVRKQGEREPRPEHIPVSCPWRRRQQFKIEQNRARVPVLI